MVAAVPDAVAAALSRKAYYFVPLTVNQGDETVIADRYDVALSDNAVCHRNLNLGDSQCVFISTRLMDDKFSVAFEFYINVGHALVEQAGVSQDFADLVWKQVEAGVPAAKPRSTPGSRASWRPPTVPDAEKYKNEYFAATFADAISIYLLSLLSRCGLLRSARARLSAAGAHADGRATAQNSRDVPAESGIRVRDLLQTADEQLGTVSELV